jgi:phage shock protein PspC (stress-responsive transcriptional regulator)
MTSTTPPPESGPRVTREHMRDISSLRRASDQRMVAGVAEGLSRHFDVDPILIRVVFAALTLFGGAGIALYVIAWISVPEEGEYDSILSRMLRRDPARVMVAGLAVAGVVALAAMIGAIGFSAPNPIPVIVISGLAIAALAIFTRRNDQRSAPPFPGPSSAATQVPPDTTAAAPPPVDAAEVPPTPTHDWWQRRDSAGSGYVMPPPTAYTPGPPPPPRPPRRPRSHLFGLTMAVIAIAMGTLWILDETVYDSIPASVYPGTVLGITAIALILGTWYGRSRLLVGVGILATLATIAATAAGPGPYGERVYRPATVGALDTTYDHGVGRMVVHLEDLTDPENLDGRTIDLDERIGQVELVIPSSLPITIYAHVDHGEIDGPLRTDVTKLDEGGEEITMTSVTAGDPDLTVNIDLDFGQIVITEYDCPTSGHDTRSSGLDTSNRNGDIHAAAACN